MVRLSLRSVNFQYTDLYKNRFAESRSQKVYLLNVLSLIIEAHRY